MRMLLIAAFAVAGTGLVCAQNGVSDPVLMTVDTQPVTRSEFEAIYKKNNRDASVTHEALDEYMELFINYKLKVREAEKLGMDTISKFQSELAGYRTQLARPYLVDRELNDQLMHEAYDRMKEEVRASHILVQVAPDAPPEDTLKAWQRITALRERVMKGEDFASVAKSKGGSDDPSAQKNGGDLGYFSALQMVYPFENVAYSTPVGQVSQPVRTRFGYHIIKVTARRPARGTMKAAHIMLRSTDSDAPDRQVSAEKKIKDVYAQLKAGTISFPDAALKYSEDESTSAKGGELPEFGTGKMIDEFEDVAFGLQNDGDISEPFKSRFGWHIVKRLSRTPVPDYEQAKAELKTKISRDSRADITRQAFLTKLKTSYHYKDYPKNMKAVYALVDTTIFHKGTVVTDTLLRSAAQEGVVMHGGLKYQREISATLHNGRAVNVRSRQHEDLETSATDTVVVRDIEEGWSYDRTKAQKMFKPVFSVDGRTYDQHEFLDYLEAKQRRERVEPIKNYVDARFQQFVDEMILAREDANLENKYPEFRMLMKEYRDGILLFELTDQMVWSKAVKDTTGLKAFHEAHRSDYMWDTRYDADIFVCKDAAAAKQLRALMDPPKKKGLRGKELVDAVNAKSAGAVDIEYGPFHEADKPLLKGMKPGVSPNIERDGKVIVVDLREVKPPAPKTLDEARGLVTAAYQDALEKEWIASLRAKYPVSVNKEVLYSIH